MEATDKRTATADPVSIQDMSKISGLSEATLRYYERIGLIAPVPRDVSSGHRRYSGPAVEMIEALSCLRATGMSVRDMRSYLLLMDEGDDSAPRMRRLFEDNVKRIDQEIERMTIRRRYLTLKADLWAARERGDAQAERRAVEELESVRGQL
ncbi:MerR family transcriptional regulator [Streptomyces sp. NPDC013178]|uniref:MerR family transcriptional regulator n=1 Tax=Streptomyces sp. NPDC013178 TaxID=3155118 RepID=UPI0033DB3C2B